MKLLNINLIYLICILLLVLMIQGCKEKPVAVIYMDNGAARTEDLAAREVRKYIYQRTGELLPVVKLTDGDAITGDAIFVGTVSSELMRSSGHEMIEMGPDDFILKTITSEIGKRLLICGGSNTGTLYAAYHFAEQLGMGFYLDGDVIPDKQVDFVFPVLDIKQSPLFSRRGIQPFHDFPEGPDWWNSEDYKAVLSQLPKLKMNFFGLHTYPEGGVGPEPLTWIGLKEDVNPDGTVKTAYHSRHFTTLNGTWGYKSTKTSDYTFDSDQLFSRDDFGAKYMKNRSPWPAPSDEAQLFNDMGSFLNDVFSFAGKLGIKTCLGTEIPLILPNQLIAQLKEKGTDPEKPETRQQIYEGIFTRIKNTHPADFYWFWTPENWTWSGNKKEDVDRTIRDFDAAIKALGTIKPVFKLATCGWVLGPAGNRALFDQYLPKDIAFSCINRYLGWEPVDPAFADILAREKWAIPWMEDDPGLSIPQLWVGRMRRDAADAYAYGCNGYLGIHWRTRILSMNVSALAKATWDQSWNPERGKRITSGEVNAYLTRMEDGDDQIRDMQSLDFYQEWCRIQFGPEASDQLSRIFSSLDGVKRKTTSLESGLSNLPRTATWINGPGNLLVNNHPWDSVESQFRFVDEIEKCRPMVSGKGNMERFDYWLNQFRYLRAFGKLACTAGEFELQIKKLASLTDNQKKELVNNKLLPLVKKEAEELKDVHFYLISSISTWGEIGNVTNWQQHIIPLQIRSHADQIKKFTADTSWMKDLYPKDMRDLSRIIVPSSQTIIETGKDFKINLICFNIQPEKATIYWRPLGSKKYEQSDLKRISETYWEAIIPSGKITDDFEYYIQAGKNGEFLYPVTAPGLSHAVVLLKNN